jgi:hypothetical protein
MQEKEGMCFFRGEVMADMIYMFDLQVDEDHSMALAQF